MNDEDLCVDINEYINRIFDQNKPLKGNITLIWSIYCEITIFDMNLNLL